jgi:hypothetical protein
MLRQPRVHDNDNFARKKRLIIGGFVNIQASPPQILGNPEPPQPSQDLRPIAV